MQRGGRVEHRDDHAPVDPMRLAVDRGNFFEWEIIRHRDPPQRDHDERIDNLQLTLEIPAALEQFFRERVAVPRRVAFDDVGNINVLSFESGRVDQFVEEFPCRADERAPGPVFVRARAFSDKKDLAVEIAFSRNGELARPG